MKLKWYCVHTHPLKETSIANRLSTQLGLEVYLPRVQLRKTIRRVRRTVIRPLFPRYIFCKFDHSTHYRAVRYASEVCDIVHFGASLAVVHPDLIQQLKDWSGKQLDIIDLGQEFSPGQSVEVIDGPLCGLRAIVSRATSDHERVMVLLGILETQVSLVIKRDHLAPA